MSAILKEYQVKFIDQKKKNEAADLDFNFWEKANCLTDFCSPWNTDSFSKIEFRALWDFDYLYFNFKVFDGNIYIDQKDDSIDSIGNSDRVELFFRKNEAMSPYYCLEMDTTARVMDFEAYPNHNFDFEWSWPKNELKLKASKESTFFILQGKISISSLKALDLIHNNIIETGVYRAKFSQNNDAQYEPTWITWVNPGTETPNFHIASSFGRFVLME
ncbi:sugar-binding protein [Flavobacterium poyangense]|uniref:sugar-binding protein n=1 Tax=Flavobacterium poyangense TaxID=2204302 RepID=UPI001424226A|nr:sugar-binding protein [Flavobacterium sp. JXAS1]